MSYETSRHATSDNIYIEFTGAVWAFGNQYKRVTRQASQQRMFSQDLQVVDYGNLTSQLRAKQSCEQAFVMIL